MFDSRPKNASGVLFSMKALTKLIFATSPTAQFHQAVSFPFCLSFLLHGCNDFDTSFCLASSFLFSDRSRAFVCCSSFDCHFHFVFLEISPLTCSLTCPDSWNLSDILWLSWVFAVLIDMPPMLSLTRLGP